MTVTVLVATAVDVEDVVAGVVDLEVVVGATSKGMSANETRSRWKIHGA